MSYNLSEMASTALEIFGLAAIVAAGVKGILYLMTPYRKMNKKVEEHEQRLNEHDEYFKNDKDSLVSLTTLTKESLKLQLSMVNHMIDGNGVEKMKEVRGEIQDKIFDMKGD